MKKVLVIVDRGIAYHVSEEGIDVRIFDVDNWKEADTEERQYMKNELSGIEHITPEWIKDIVESE